MSLPRQFVEGLALSPDDWADWCVENDVQGVAACLRWMVHRQKRPYRGSAGRGTWFNADTIMSGLGDPESDIPGAVFGLLDGGQLVANHKAYTTLAKAEE